MTDAPALLTEDEAYQRFRVMRWPDTDGDPVCPYCGRGDSYALKRRGKFSCRQCARQFSVTTGTIFSHRKISFASLYQAMVLFVQCNACALTIAQRMGIQYKTAYVITAKMRAALASVETADDPLLGVMRAAMDHPKSDEWCGYWQRGKTQALTTPDPPSLGKDER